MADQATIQAAQFVLKSIAAEGVHTAFLVPGGLIDDFMPAFKAAGVTPIVAAHEAGAGFMADGYVRARLAFGDCRAFGVCMALGGPGAANLVPPMASAYADKSPLLAICGEVPSDWEGRGYFQDAHATDVELMQPITAFRLELPPAVPLKPSLTHDLIVALRTVRGNPPRPVFLSLPQQLQKENVDDAYQPLQFPEPVMGGADTALAALKSSSKIAILAGNGAVRSVDPNDLKHLAQQYSIPVATTLRAKGLFPELDQWSLKNFGYAGSRFATIWLTPQDDPLKPVELQVDVLIILGSSLNQRDTLYRNNPGLPKVTLQVDTDPTVFGRNYPVTHPVLADAGAFVKWMLNDQQARNVLNAGKDARVLAYTHYMQWCRQHNVNIWWYDPGNMESNAVPIHPARAVAELANAAPNDLRLLVDSGAHRAFAAHYCLSSWAQSPTARTYVATTMAPMGWAIAAAIGAKCARPEYPCAVITGDGCMLMHGMEIQTAVRYGLKIVFVVINNSAHGIDYLRVKDSNMPPAALELTKLPQRDWVKFAKAFGANGKTVTDPGQLRGVFQEAFESSLPYVVDVICDPNAEPPLYPWKNAKQRLFD